MQGLAYKLENVFAKNLILTCIWGFLKFENKWTYRKYGFTIGHTKLNMVVKRSRIGLFVLEKLETAILIEEMQPGTT